MDEIRLRISNLANNMTYKKILLRKFFYMVFIDVNGRKLYVYIATVFGGIMQDVDSLDEICRSVQHESGNPCSLQFEFTSPGDNEKLIESVVFKDLTQSFWDQSSCIEKVWGKCQKYDDQARVSELLTKTYPDLYPDGTGAMVDVTQGIYYINQRNKPSHICIAAQGGYEDMSKDSQHIYKLSCPSSGKKIDGLEAMNWVQAEITLPYSILNKPVLFSVELDKDRIYTPDFTWYFAPPPGNVVSGDSYVRIGREGEERNEKNAIQSVSDETTVLFKEWKKRPLAIEERKKSRVLFELAPVKNRKNLSEDSVLAVVLRIANPQESTNRQFLVGLLVAFFLAFCSDKTRINDYYKCLSENCGCVEGHCICRTVCDMINILSPILLMCSFMTFILKPQKSFPHASEKQKILLRICWGISLLGTVFLMLYIFVLWLVFSEQMKSVVGCQANNWILICGFAVSMVFNVVYLVYCLGIWKRKILNYL